MKAPSPAFSFYPKDVLSDERCAAMTHEEFGAYVRLLCHAWLEGSIPSEPVKLARILGLRAQAFGRIWPSIAPCFEASGNRLIQSRLERERSLQRDRSARQAAKGRKGGRPIESTKPKSRGFFPGKPNESRTKAEKSLPSPSPSPYNGIPLPPPPSEAPVTGDAPPAVADSGNGKARPWNQRACDPVVKRYGGTAPGGRITRALRPLVARHGEDAVLDAWARYVDETEAEYLSPERFATTFSRWARHGPRRLGDGCSTAGAPVDDAVVARVEARRRVAASTPRAPGESTEDYVRRVDAAVEGA